MEGCQKVQKKRTRWDSEAERKLIEIWADILQETNGKMMTRKKKEALATKQLNEYLETDLDRAGAFTEKDVHNKIDGMLKKGKQFYAIYKKKVTGKKLDDEMTIDMEAAEAAWPNFKTFYSNFKDHPSLGPGTVEDSAAPPAVDEVELENVVEPFSPNDSVECQSKASTAHDDSGEEQVEEEEDVVEYTPPPSKKTKEAADASTSRMHKKKDRTSSSMATFMSWQKSAQESQMNHERKLQEEQMAFQAKLEQDRIRFESEMSMRLQHLNNQFQQNMMQQNQVFQAELFKRLFDKSTDKDKE